jgi:tRNA (guanine37-N1)-methyltransferase
MHFDLVSIFPEMFAAITDYGVSSRGLKLGAWSFRAWNLRDFTDDNYRRIDDRPYGGGPGMVMLPGPMSLCLDAVHQSAGIGGSPAPVILMSPQGRRLDQALLLELMLQPRLCVIAGRYEALDQRLIERRVSMEISVGDFVVSGGELPAMMLMDALIRRIPGVVNDGQSILQDSFEDGLLDCQHYTRPEDFEGLTVPDVLLSGHHLNIERWRRQQKLRITWERRPDLIQAAREKGLLSPADLKVLAEFDKSPQKKL